MYAKVFLLLLIVELFIKTNQRQLKFIEVVSRHGVRYPSYPNDYDHSNITTIRNAHNELTIQGKSMHYLLGRQLYHKYWKLLFANTPYESKYHQSLILAKSTNTNRTIQSLQSQLIGLLQDLNIKTQIKPNQYYYPPFTIDNRNSANLTASQELKLSSIFTFPIHVEKGAEGDPKIANLNNQGDFLVKQQTNLCPNQPIWQQNNFDSPFGLNIQSAQKLKPAFDKLNYIFHRNNVTIRDAFKYVDNYICLKAMGEPYLPDFQTPQLQDSFEFLYVSRLYLSFLYTQQQKKTFSTRLIANTIQNMNNSLKENTPKIVLYAAHDITIAVLLASMNFSSIQCISERFLTGKNDSNCYYKYPAFASTFIFEFWQQDNKQLTVSMLINGQPYRIPICNYSLKCQIRQFQTWFSRYRVQSPNRQCGVDNGLFYNHSNWLSLLLVFLSGFISPILYRKYIQNFDPTHQHTSVDTQVSDLIE